MFQGSFSFPTLSQKRGKKVGGKTEPDIIPSSPPKNVQRTARCSTSRLPTVSPPPIHCLCLFPNRSPRPTSFSPRHRFLRVQRPPRRLRRRQDQGDHRAPSLHPLPARPRQLAKVGRQLPGDHEGPTSPGGCRRYRSLSPFFSWFEH